MIPLKESHNEGSGKKQRRNDRNAGGEARNQGRTNLRRMGWPIGPEAADIGAQNR